jgi:Arc/MetJ-type ribon-helix-helix transcriptional regulator
MSERPRLPDERVAQIRDDLESGWYIGGAATEAIAYLLELLAEAERERDEALLDAQRLSGIARAKAFNLDGQTARADAAEARVAQLEGALREIVEMDPGAWHHPMSKIATRALTTPETDTLAEALGASEVRRYGSHDEAVRAEMKRRTTPETDHE